jgi:hypothetical protein
MISPLQVVSNGAWDYAYASTSQSQLPIYLETAQGVQSTDMRQKAMKIS